LENNKLIKQLEEEQSTLKNNRA